MSLLYRALWECDASNADAVIAHCHAAFSLWASTTPPDRERKYVTRDDFDIPHALEERCIDTDSSGQVWRTQARFRVVDERLYVVVENHSEGDDVTSHISVGRPRVVSDLLRISKEPTLGDLPVFTETTVAIGVADIPTLIALLNAPNRALPAIVFTEPPVDDPEVHNWNRMAKRVAVRTTGVASVFTLDRDATAAFRHELGDLATWGGAIRTYAPVPLDQASSHRYIPRRSILVQHRKNIEDRLVFAVAQQSARRRVLVPLAGPDWEAVPRAEATATIEELRVTLQELRKDYARIRQNADELEQQYEELFVEHDDVQKDLTSKVTFIERLREAFASIGREDLFWENTQPSDSVDMPQNMDSVSDAILAAQLYLGDLLAVPESCGCELDKLDTAQKSAAWGNTTWRYFIALASYVRDRREGFPRDFFTWCKEGRPNAISVQNVALNESDTVRKNASLRAQRTFEVSRKVEPSGRIFMASHLKIGEGGNLSPRLYFHDDTSGPTGIVHVGFVGPHYRVANTKS